MFGDVRHEWSLKKLLPLTDLDIIKQSNFKGHELNFWKTLALEKLHRLRTLKEYVAVSIIDLHFSA